MIEKEKVERVLSQLRPALNADGGDVELVEVTENNEILIRLVGACAGCPMSQMTLQMGIEQALREEIPEIERVLAV
ncbi:MAG: NifU family protein [Candidatus Tectomicrobia bacterium]|uniref:NifU family protein n=1 Tax=Tectimicrobiota bacterium TaxID=2528274 RepID=A0A932M171_UNCTE|nr:NifU family protein [Candidatus Tectomicrobia bacterium]